MVVASGRRTQGIPRPPHHQTRVFSDFGLVPFAPLCLLIYREDPAIVAPPNLPARLTERISLGDLAPQGPLPRRRQRHVDHPLRAAESCSRPVPCRPPTPAEQCFQHSSGIGI